MIQLLRLAASLLVGSLIVLACFIGNDDLGRPLGDRTLSLVVGSNPTKKGGGSFTCTDALVAQSKGTLISSTDCTKLRRGDPLLKKHPTCVSCAGNNNFSLIPSPKGKQKIVAAGNITCTTGPLKIATINWTYGTCGFSNPSSLQATCLGTTGQDNGPCNVRIINVSAQQAVTTTITIGTARPPR